MRAAPSKRSRPRSVVGRLLRWIGGGIGLILIGIVLYGLGSFMFSPSAEKMKREVELRVLQIDRQPQGVGEEVAATAEILLEGRSVYLVLDEEQATELRENDRLLVRYRRTAFSGLMTVDDWETLPRSDDVDP